MHERGKRIIYISDEISMLIMFELFTIKLHNYSVESGIKVKTTEN